MHLRAAILRYLCPKSYESLKKKKGIPVQFRISSLKKVLEDRSLQQSVKTNVKMLFFFYKSGIVSAFAKKVKLKLLFLFGSVNVVDLYRKCMSFAVVESK